MSFALTDQFSQTARRREAIPPFSPEALRDFASSLKAYLETLDIEVQEYKDSENFEFEFYIQDVNDNSLPISLYFQPNSKEPFHLMTGSDEFFSETSIPWKQQAHLIDLIVGDIQDHAAPDLVRRMKDGAATPGCDPYV